MGTMIPCYKLQREVKFRCRNGKLTDMKTKGKCQAEGKHSEKWPQALKMKEMHVKVPSEENYRV